MPRSERAAGLVPFVVMLVLFLAALAWAYGNYTDLDQAKKDKITAETERDAKSADLQQMTQDYYGLRDSAGTGDGAILNADIERLVTALRNEAQVSYISEKLDFLPGGDINTGADGKVVRNYLTGGKAANAFTASDIGPSLIAMVKAMKADLTAFDKSRKATLGQIEKAKSDMATAITDKDSDFDRQRTALLAQLGTKDTRIDDLTNEKTRAEGDARQARADAETARNRLKEIEDATKMTLATMREEVKRAKKDIAITRTDAPDGEVTGSSSATGLVWINLGRENNLKPGTVFQVFTRGKGGDRVMKGVIRVLAPDTNTAKCGVVSGKNFVAGDEIYNRLYHPGKSLRFAVIGRMDKYGTSQAKSILTKLGNTIDAKVSMHTDYLLVGTSDDGGDITQTDDYKEAMRYGVQIITERDLELFTNY